MKYCIGCEHFDMTPSDAGSMGSSWTGRWGEKDAEAFCKRNHWQLELGEHYALEDFRLAMEKAETCDDYEEREAP